MATKLFEVRKEKTVFKIQCFPYQLKWPDSSQSGFFEAYFTTACSTLSMLKSTTVTSTGSSLCSKAQNLAADSLKSKVFLHSHVLSALKATINPSFHWRTISTNRDTQYQSYRALVGVKYHLSMKRRL